MYCKNTNRAKELNCHNTPKGTVGFVKAKPHLT